MVFNRIVTNKSLLLLQPERSQYWYHDKGWQNAQNDSTMMGLKPTIFWFEVRRFIH